MINDDIQMLTPNDGMQAYPEEEGPNNHRLIQNAILNVGWYQLHKHTNSLGNTKSQILWNLKGMFKKKKRI